jgi:hypothetical protein
MQASYQIQGREVRLPVRVAHARSLSALYAVRTAAVRRLVDHPALQIPELIPGRTLCALACIEYLENDLGRYNEIAVAFFVQHRRDRPWRFGSLPWAMLRGSAGAYIHRLPVNQAFTCEAGRSIWGFPKSVDEIEFEDRGGRRACTWKKDASLVLRFEAATGGKGSFSERALTAWSCLDGVLRRTPFVSSGSEVGGHLGGATLVLGDHPIAAELRELGLPRRALATSWVGRMSAEFRAPEKPC